MPQERKPHYDVISGLQELSCQADSMIEENDLSMSSYDSGLKAWFEAVKSHITLIKNCNSIDEIGDGPPLNTFLGETNTVKKVAVPDVQKAHVHSSAPSENANKPEEKAQAETNTNVTFKETRNCYPAASEMTTNTPVSANAKAESRVPQIAMHTPMIKIANSSVSKSKSCKTLDLVETPVLNRTFNKISDKTFMLDSGVCSGENTKLMTSAINAVKTESGLPNNVVENIVHGMITRSGSKRKSTNSANKVNKKYKTEASTCHSKTPGKKIAQPRFPLANKNSKAAVTAVIVPSGISLPQKKTVSKEQQTLEELKKKEKKAKENIRRVLTERQMKAELNKKAREEKQSKTLQKRLQIEKEKEGRLEKREVEVKTAQVKIVKESLTKQPEAKTRTQELIDHHAAVNKSGTPTFKQSGDMPKTPASKKSPEYENYELTPLPNSSTYNFSDDEEDEKPQGKPIPLWAQGVLLKSALIEQHYHPVDADELFGTVIDPPNLEEIFGVNKKHYMIRTSSAVWNSPPTKYMH